MPSAQLLGIRSRPISPLSTAGASSSLAPVAFPPCGDPVPATYVASLSPRARPHSFFGAVCADRMADMSVIGIVYRTDRVHIARVAEARSESSSLGPRIATPGLAIVSSSLDLRSSGRAHFLLPCSLPHFQGPVSGQGPIFFRFGPRCHSPRKRESPFILRTLTDCRCVSRMAGMTQPALLTGRSKPICVRVAGRRSVSSSLGPALRRHRI